MRTLASGNRPRFEKPDRQATRSPADDIDVANIDTADGEAIVKNVFGDNEEQVVNQLGGLGGGEGGGGLGDMLGGLLGGGGDGGGGGLGDLLGGLLGGGKR